MSTAAEAAELLDLLIEKAPSLQAAGVKSGEVGPLKFELHPAESEFDAEAFLQAQEDEAKPPRDALHDPATFGGRKIPRVTRE